VCSVGSHHAESVEPLDERDLAALHPTQLLHPVGKRLARPLAAAELSQFVEQTRRRVVVGSSASLDQLDDFLPRPLLPPREFAQVVLAGAFSGATALLCPSLGVLPGHTLPVFPAPPGVLEENLRGPGGAVAGLDRPARPPANSSARTLAPSPRATRSRNASLLSTGSCANQPDGFVRV
jgi:hypothetical protein